MNKKTLPPPPDFDSPEEAKDIIHFLWNKLAELEDRLNQNSRNSSVPSSQQPLHNKAKNTSPNRKKSGKKQGAQPGHKGHRRLLHPVEDSASVEQYLPNKICHCGGCVIPNRKPYKRHQIFDLPDISYTLVEHQIFKGECAWCGDKHQAELPEYVPDVQMGPNLHSFIAIQVTQHHQSIGKIQSMLKDVFQLKTYLEDGHISIDNNVTERDIRPFTTGRKNWMFSTSVGGAKASANLYSLVMTCRANDINPYYYFRHLFAELPKRTLADDMSDLMPWNVDLSSVE